MLRIECRASGACVAVHRSLPALVAPLLMPHLRAVTDTLKQLFPAAVTMLEKCAAAGGQTAPASVALDDSGNDGLKGIHTRFSTGFCMRPLLHKNPHDACMTPAARLSMAPHLQGFASPPVGLRNVADAEFDGGSGAGPLSLVVHTQRPRLLVCGREGCGQSHLGPAILDALDGLPVYSVGLPSLLSDVSARCAYYRPPPSTLRMCQSVSAKRVFKLAARRPNVTLA